MMELRVYNQEGKETGSADLPRTVFGLPWNDDLVHEVLSSMRVNARRPKAQARGRSEVAGGGRKPWRQKGTGRARHGSSRSPIWRGGGVTHGPTAERDTTRKINKKAKAKALFTLLSRKYKDNEILGLSELNIAEGKTKQAATVVAVLAQVSGFKQLAYKTGRRALLVSSEFSREAKRSFRNIPSALLAETKNLNPLDLAVYKYLVLIDPAKNVELLTGWLKSNKKAKENV